MALESQQIDYLFTKGLNEDVSDVVDAQGLTYAVNVQFGKEGELNKRPGLASGITDTWRNHGSLLTTGKDVAMVSSQAVNVWNTAAGSSGKTLRAPALPATLTTNPITRAAGNVRTCDGAYYSDGTVSCHAYVWETVPSGGYDPSIVVAIVDATTGAVLFGPYTVDTITANTPSHPRVVALASKVLVFYTNSSANLWCASFTFTSGVPAYESYSQVVASLGSMSSTGGQAPRFDACTDGTVAFVSYRSSGSRAETKRVDSSRTVTHTYTETTDDAANSIACASIGSSVIVAYTTGTAVDITVRQLLASNLTSQQYYTTTAGANNYKLLLIAPTSYDTGTWYFVGGCDPSDTYPGITGSYRRLDAGGSPSTSQLLAANFVPVSKMFALYNGNSDELLPAVYGYDPGIQSATQPFVYGAAFFNDKLVDGTSGDAPSRLNSAKRLTFARAQSSADIDTSYHYQPTAYAHGSGVSYVVSCVLRSRTGIESIASGGAITYERSMDRVTLDYSQGKPIGRVTSGGVAYLAGAITGYYDGLYLSELQPFYAPKIASAAESGSGSLANGTYSYKAVYEWKDKAGLLHRSAPSAAVSCTISATKDATVVVWATRFAMHRARYEEGTGATTSNNDDFYRVVLYRTKASGTVYYRVASSPIQPSYGIQATFTDSTEDADLSDEEILYTAGGILANDVPPASVDIAVGNSRLWIIDAEDPRRVWFSKPMQPGIAPEFSDSLTVTCPKQLRAIEVMDDKLVMFSSDDIYLLTGDGPDATGAGAFTGPTALESPVGCVNAASVVKTGDGIYFASARSIELLTRGLQVLEPPIGAPLRDTYNAQTIVSSDYCSLADEVRFVTSETANSVLVWNMRRKAWCTWDFLAYPSITSVVDSEYVLNDDGTAEWFVLLKTGGNAALTRMDSGSVVYADGGTFYGITVQTPIFRFGGLRNRVRVRDVALLLKRHAATQFTLYSSLDGRVGGPITGSNGTDTSALSSTVLGNANSGQGEGTGLIEWSLPVQKCGSVSFELVEATAGTADTQGCTLYGLTMDVGMKGKRARLPLTRRK